MNVPRNGDHPNTNKRARGGQKPKSAAQAGGGVRSIGNLVGQLVASRGYASVMTDAAMLESVLAALGPSHSAPDAGTVRVGRLRAGVLQIHVGDSVMLQELNFQKRSILRRLQKDFPDQVHDLRFRILVG
ncbi:MAG: DUF721 domain-containing protein [Planctomycetota bacterium]